MAQTNGAAPFLVSGGGIGGLAAAYALARQGLPVRVFEQSPEFREVGAGIQLGPNIFRVLEKIGLKDAILADAHRPPAQEMRDALTGKLITHIPLGEAFFKRFGQPYAVTHRADIHGTFLKACQDHNLITLENSRRVESSTKNTATASPSCSTTARRVDGRALIGCDGMWSKIRERIVGDGKPRVSGHIAYRAVLKRDDVPEDLWRPDVVLWAGPRTHFVHYPLAPRRTLQSGRRVPFRPLRGGLERRRQQRTAVAAFQGPACRKSCACSSASKPGACGCLCDREPVKNWSNGRVTLLGDAAHPMLQYLAQGACMATEDAVVLAEKVAAAPDDLPAAFQAYTQDRYLRTARTQIMARVYGDFYHARGVTAELRDLALAARTPEQSYEGIAWLYGGP